MTKIPYTIEEIRDALQARVEGSKSFDRDFETEEWENTFLMNLLLHVYDGLDTIDTRILAIQNRLERLDVVRHDAKSEGETPIP